MSDHDDRMGRIEEHIINIKQIISRNTTILDINTRLLDEHIKRTNVLEKQVAGLSAEARILRWATVIATGAVAVMQAIKMFG